jgi:DNA-binding LytR/AlgR family response regulator
LKKKYFFYIRLNFDKTRVINFCDAVYSIAVTLLVLEIVIPSYKELKTNNNLEILQNRIPNFIGLIVNFLVIANERNPHELWYMLKSVFLPAIATILHIIIFGRFAFGKYKNKKTEAQKIKIKGDGNYEGLRLFFNDIICIQSSDNYVEVFYSSGNELKKSLIRNKLSFVADEFTELLRTHRSYLINPYHFLQWKTEKGRIFVLLFHHIEVPVS